MVIVDLEVLAGEAEDLTGSLCPSAGAKLPEFVTKI